MLTRAWTFLAPLPAIAVGAAVAAHHGVAVTAFLPNLLAVVIGVMVFLVLDRAGLNRAAPVVIGLAVVGVLGTLFATPLDGVTRWLGLGPLRLHASSALMPYLFCGFASPHPNLRRVSFAAVVVVQGLHVLQPDAGQATVLAAAVPTMMWRQHRGPRAASASRVVGGVVDAAIDSVVVVVVAALAIITWSRPDPLARWPTSKRFCHSPHAAGPWPWRRRWRQPRCSSRRVWPTVARPWPSSPAWPC